MTAPRSRTNISVAYRVLHEGLKNEGRHEARERIVISLQIHGKSRAHPETFEPQVALRELPFILERDKRDIMPVETQRVSKQLGESLDGVLGDGRIDAQQLGD